MDDCVFCKIIRKELPSSIESENDKVIAFKSKQPVAEIHVLIVPKKHIETFMDFKDEDNKVLTEMVKMAQKIIMDKKLEAGYKLVVNGGKYQSVPHFHWHLLAGKLEDSHNILNKT